MSAAQVTAEILRRIDEEVRPKLDRDKYDDGYNCCGCSTYELIVADIERIVREVAAS